MIKWLVVIDFKGGSAQEIIDDWVVIDYFEPKDWSDFFRPLGHLPDCDAPNGIWNRDGCRGCFGVDEKGMPVIDGSRWDHSANALNAWSKLTGFEW